MFTGAGRDELLAGYSRYRMTLLGISVGGWYHPFLAKDIRHLIRGIGKNMAPQRLL